PAGLPAQAPLRSDGLRLRHRRVRVGGGRATLFCPGRVSLHGRAKRTMGRADFYEVSPREPGPVEMGAGADLQTRHPREARGFSPARRIEAPADRRGGHAPGSGPADGSRFRWTVRGRACASLSLSLSLTPTPTLTLTLTLNEVASI